MAISSVSGYGPTPVITPQKPAAPTPPAGGNIEHRQPPSQPAAPSRPPQAAATSGRGSKLDLTV
ncbi:MAG: hypothetical protein WCO00_16225 [Rhodospirillaceae bacterium]